jgi:uncharacterized protein YndB with AHSA1/START domain
MATLDVRPGEWNDEAPVRIEVSRSIDASAEAVFAVLADHERWPEWFASLSKVEVTGAPSGVGARRRVHLRPTGVFDEEFYAWEEGRVFGFSVVKASAPLLRAANEIITIDEADDAEQGIGVVVTYVQALEPTRWIAPFLGLARRRLETALAEGLDQLAARVESPGSDRSR